MTQATRLEPLPPARARQLLGLMRQAHADPDTALALDEGGHLLGVVPAEDPRPEHVLGDLDVHA
jgi:hypothetical protein